MKVSIRTGRFVVAAICSLSAGAALAEWTAPAPGARAAGASPDAVSKAAAPVDARMPFDAAVAVPQGADSGPTFRLWSQMTAEERANIWPYLDEVAKNMHWREMTKREQKALASCLSEGDRDDLRRRFTIDPDELRQTKRASHAVPQRPHRLNREELRLMRQQIIEVHLEYSGKRAAHRCADGGQTRVNAEGPADDGGTRR